MKKQGWLIYDLCSIRDIIIRFWRTNPAPRKHCFRRDHNHDDDALDDIYLIINDLYALPVFRFKIKELWTTAYVSRYKREILGIL